MARKKTTTIEEIDTLKIPPFVEQEEEQEEEPGGDVYELSASERIAEIKARGEIQGVKSRIYAVTSKGREFVGTYEDIAEDDYLAEKYGPGKYMVFYIYRNKEGRRVQSSENFNISELYRGPRENVQERATHDHGGTLGGFLEKITAENVAGIMAAVQGLKAIFAPPPPPVDMTELIKALAAPRQNIGDAVLIKALEGVNRPTPAPAPSILDQIKQINEVKEILGASEGAGGNDTMDKFINIGLSMLPALLQRNGGNYQAAGAAVKENPFINGLIEKDPELLARFCTATAEKYGEQAARELAAGFGYSYENAPQQQEPQQIEEQTAEPPKG